MLRQIQRLIFINLLLVQSTLKHTLHFEMCPLARCIFIWLLCFLEHSYLRITTRNVASFNIIISSVILLVKFVACEELSLPCSISQVFRSIAWGHLIQSIIHPFYLVNLLPFMQLNNQNLFLDYYFRSRCKGSSKKGVID